ncbi:holo-ACP synthase [Alishewanella sp. d11]|uniref:holo-ACP synthase n=1 Tax=Alishewanella sp. d11 TaxID=3414030 RepID=UPI003BF817B1
MAIRGLGTDIIEIARIRHSLEKSPRLVQRVLTPFEQAEYARHAQPERYFAKRFAAKEAAAKAFGTGIGSGISFQHFEITNDALGKPELRCSGYAAELATKMGVNAVWLSISDEQAYACATVILEA